METDALKKQLMEYENPVIALSKSKKLKILDAFFLSGYMCLNTSILFCIYFRELINRRVSSNDTAFIRICSIISSLHGAEIDYFMDHASPEDVGKLLKKIDLIYK